ncbi:MAG: hypothetical protein IT438_07240 [Phycisphaerales bacterium]|nr:hypothetical protein [Phycisphaerales bacterium]
MAVWSVVKTCDMTHDIRWDAEHYRPEYLRQERQVRKLRTKALVEVASVSDGNHMSIAEEFGDEGVRYLRGQDLADFFISDADPIYIPEKHYDGLTRSHMFPGDVLVGVVGTIGTVGLVTKRHGKLTGNCKLAIVRSKTLPGEYIAAYLASRLGQYEIKRRIRGAVQMGLILPDLKEIPIVEPTKQQLDRVVSAVQGAQDARHRAAETIAAAEARLMAALGLDRLDLAQEKCYTRRFRDLRAAARFGAEYFMPCKKRILDALSKMPHQTVEAHAPGIRDMYDPARARKGEMVRNFDITDALEPFLDDSREPEAAVEMGSSKKRFQAGDVVVSRLRSYLKEIAVVRTSAAPQSVGSSEYIVLRPTGKGLSPETLMVYLRCPLVQTILKWSQDGSNHPRFTEEDLLAIPVPDKVLSVRKQIDGLVNKAIDARIEAARLLEQAKKTVEDLIAGKP